MTCMNPTVTSYLHQTSWAIKAREILNPDLGTASYWLSRMGNLIQPIRSTTQIWEVMRHQYGICALVSQTSFGKETSTR